MDDCRRVVPGVLALEQGFGHAGFAQIAVHIAPAHAFVDGVLKAAAHDMHVLSQVGENHSQTCVLADGHFLARGDVRVFQQLVQDVAAHRRRLLRAGRAQAFKHVAGQAAAGLHGQRGHGLADGSDVNFLHVRFSRQPTDGRARSWE